MEISEDNFKKYQIYTTSKGNIRSKNYRKTFYNAVCPHCSKEFLARTRNRKNGIEFCSQDCSSKLTAKGFGYRGGYKVLFGNEHPKRVGKLEHRFIIEQFLGRLLKPIEEVHHINGNPLDNRNPNLLVCDRGYHKWLHHKMSGLYMKEHFA